MDYSRVGKSAVKRLHDSAFASNTFIPAQDKLSVSTSSVLRSSKEKMVFNKLRKKDYAISKLIEDEARLAALLADQGGGKSNLVKSTEYSAGFYAYLDQRRAFLGCKPLFFPDGQIPVCNTTVKLDEGAIEDFILFLCNGHSVMNCVYSCDGAPVDRTGNRLIYITQNCLAFFLSAISGAVFDYIGLSNRANIVFDILVTTPATIAMAKVMKALYVCPIGFSVEYQAANPWVVTVVRWLGKLAMVPIVLAIGALLVLSAIFSCGRNTAGIIVSFFLQVQLYGFFLELIFNGLMFMSSVYTRVTIDLSIRSIVLLEIGRRYAEMIHHKGLLIEGKDYHYRCKYVCYLLRIEYIYTYDDAVKKGYVDEVDRVQGDMEMQVTSALHRDSNTGDDGSKPSLFDRASSTIYKSDEFSTESSFQYDVTAVDDRVSMSALYDVGKTTMMPTFEVKSNESWNKMRDVTTPASEEELYQEYQNEVKNSSSNSSKLTSTASNNYDFDEVSLSFEEWKIEKKKFKAGTRLLTVTHLLTHSPNHLLHTHSGDPL